MFEDIIPLPFAFFHLIYLIVFPLKEIYLFPPFPNIFFIVSLSLPLATFLWFLELYVYALYFAVYSEILPGSYYFFHSCDAFSIFNSSITLTLKVRVFFEVLHVDLYFGWHQLWFCSTGSNNALQFTQYLEWEQFECCVLGVGVGNAANLVLFLLALLLSQILTQKFCNALAVFNLFF